MKGLREGCAVVEALQLFKTAMTVDMTAEYLGLTQKQIHLAIAERLLPCGVLARCWTGYAIKDFLSQPYGQNGFVKDFWYLHANSYYPLIVNTNAEVDVTYLVPHEKLVKYGNINHPSVFPEYPFLFVLEKEQKYSPRITISDVLILKDDADCFFHTHCNDNQSNKPSADQEKQALTSGILSREHPCFAPELEAAIVAWLDLFSNGKMPAGQGATDAIGDWLRKNRPEIAKSNRALERIQTVANPNKSGGAPKTPS